jgi:large subunit ribosomal protein L17
MRHRCKGRKLGRTWAHRKSMMRNLVTSLFEHEQVETTDAKAKEVRSVAERLITLAKRGGGGVAGRRQAARVVRDRRVVKKLFEEIAPRYADRPGGYTRIVKVESRLGDSAPLSILQLVKEPVTFKERKARTEDEPAVPRRAPAKAVGQAVAEAEVPTEATAAAGGAEKAENA